MPTRLPWLTFLLALLLLAPTLSGQVPTTLSYQGRLLANDATGAPASGTVDIVFSIWSDSTGGTQLWTESWTGVALSNGVFSVLLGSNGTPLDPADFQGDTSLFLELEIDGETLSPRQQLGSAPFAIVDEPANELQDLELSGSTLTLSGDATPVDLGGFVDTDDQQLSLDTNTLSLDNGGSVDLAGYLDNTDDQALSLLDTTLSLENGGSVDLGALAASLGGPTRTVFVTNGIHPGSSGGVAAFDAICQSEADAAGLTGTFITWTSEIGGTNPADRLASASAARYVLTDGTEIADSWADLTDGTLAAPINLDALGGAPTAHDLVWSATITDGTPDIADGRDCEAWTATTGGGPFGFRTATDATWTDSGNGAFCGASAHLYCFQLDFSEDSATNYGLELSGSTLSLQDANGTLSVDLGDLGDQELSRVDDELRLTSNDGTDAVDLSDLDESAELTSIDTRIAALESELESRVFVTSQSYDGDLGGLTGADAICQSLADAAGLGGIYLAWLSDDTGSPSTRFDRSGSFELIDGTVVAEDWDDLTDGTLQAAIDLTELGTVTSSFFVWSNTQVDGSREGGNDCGDWSSNASGTAPISRPDRTDATWTDESALGSCSGSGNPFYCFEQTNAFNANSQTLTLDGNTLQLSSSDGPDSIDLSGYLDNTDEQDLSLSGTTLSLSGDPTSVDLSSFDVDTDNQQLSLSGNSLQLTSDDGTDTVDLSSLDVDNQELSLSGNSLQLTSDDGTDTVDLSSFAVDTDNQELSLNGSNLQLTSDDGTDTVDLASVDAQDVDCFGCIGGRELSNRLVLVRIDCNGECSDMSIEAACDSAEDQLGLSYQLEPLSVSCIHAESSSTGNGYSLCSTGAVGHDNECRSYELGFSTGLQCGDGDGHDVDIMCIETE